MDIKKIIGPVVFIVMSISSISFAGTYHVELNASQSTIEAIFDNRMAVEQGFLTAGIGAIYREDDYKIAHVKLTLGNGISFARLSFNLGFKGVLGNIENDNKEADLMAIGFLFSGTYTIPETISPLPVDFSLGLSMAPDPLCFLDSDRYMDFRVSLDFRIVKNAAIILGYRYIEVRLDEDPGDWEMSDGTLFIGYQLKF